MRGIFLVFSVAFIIPGAGAQQLLKGKIYDRKTDSVLASTTVYNSSTKLYVLSAREGDYAIVAKEGDKVIFTSVGYLPDTVKVLNYMLDAGYDITMTLKNNMLKNVTVRGSSYQADSLNRREGYSEFYNRPKNELLSKTGPQNGVGLSFSPISFFSKKSKEKKMNKNLQYQEEQDFVDYAFSRRYVGNLTNLHGDSLLQFMLRYRPSYLFCRNASSEDMLQYINEKLMLYLKHEDMPLRPKN
ncbi:MAG: hypothetical protein ABIQ88_13180 [Chitinophagaceae bacterium]